MSNPTGKGGFAERPEDINRTGQNRREKSWGEAIGRITNMTREEAIAFVGANTKIGKALKELSPKMPIKDALIFASIIAYGRDPNARMLTALMDREDGRPNQSIDLNTTGGANGSKIASLPAELIAPDFLNVYRDIKQGNHSEYALDGGRGSTKSSFISLVSTVLLVDNPDVHMLALRQVKDTLKTSVYSQLVWAISELGLSDSFKCTESPLEITYLPTGQMIYFRGADDPTKIKSIKPPFGYIGILWFEEFDQFRGEEQVRNIVQSTFRGGDHAWRFESWNTPRTKNHWLNKYIAVPKSDRYYHHSNYLNVPPEWIGKIFIDEAEHLKSVNPPAYEHEYLGIANNIGGAVFTNVRIEPITDEQIKEFDRVLHGLDWGYYPDPASFGKMHYDAARRILYIFGEGRYWKLSNEKLFNQLVDDELIAKVEYKERGKVTASYPDLIIADSAEPKSVGDFRAFRANCRGAEKGPESVKYSMKWLQGLTAIVIDNVRAPYHAEEFLSYEYERTKDGEIISEYPDKNNHAIDDTRYATNMIWKRRGE